MERQHFRLKFLVMLWVASLFLQLSALAQSTDNQRKIDPALRHASLFQERFPDVPSSALENYLPGKKLPRTVGHVVWVLIKARRDIRQTVRGFGGRVGSQHGAIATAILPLDVVEQLARDDAIEYIEASRILYDDLDLNVSKTGADVLHQQINPAQLVIWPMVVPANQNSIRIDLWAMPGGQRNVKATPAWG